MKPGRTFALAVTGLLWSLAAIADGQHVFWEVAGRHNTVYLLGSIHLLQSSDRALPEVVEAAYLDAETVVEELDFFTMGSELASSAAQDLQRLPPGQTLAQVLGPALHERLQQQLESLRIDGEPLSGVRPWYAALLVMQARLTQGGFRAEDGVDFQIAQRAQGDRKSLRGLESAVDQLAVFAAMPMAEQREFLRTTLDETDMTGEVAQIGAAWRRGDLVMLEDLLRSGAEESPAFFKALTTDRNLKWLPQIEAMLAHPEDDYLVVTGALHMVGDDGLVELLRRRGYRVDRR